MKYFLLILLSFVLVIEVQAKEHDWENAAVTSINRLAPTSWFISYDEGEAYFPLAHVESTNRFRLLNGEWNFRWYSDVSKRDLNFYNMDYDYSMWDKIDVPCSWQMRGYGIPIYKNIGFAIQKDYPRVKPKYTKGLPVGQYIRSFNVPDTWDGDDVYLRFDGVESAFYVWVNGKMVGYGEDSRRTSMFDITPYINKGKNRVAVEVYRFSDGVYLEDQDGWRLSGIFRDVAVMAKPKLQINDITVRTPLSDNYKKGKLWIDVDIKNHMPIGVKGSLEASLIDAKGLEVVTFTKSLKDIKANSETTVHLEQSIDNPLLWSCDFPNLYHLVLRSKDVKGNVREVVAQEIGFREIKVHGLELYMNGRSIIVKGVNRVEHDPLDGKAVRYSMLLKDIQLMKENNINCIRTSHYPHDPHLYTLCDRYGIMVIDEANVESHGYSFFDNPIAVDPAWKKPHCERMEAMVERDKNHASVIMWSLGNEAGNGANFMAMHNLAHKLDPTRPTHYHFDTVDRSCDILGGIYRNGSVDGYHIGANRYISIPDLEFAASCDKYDRPILMNEYAHAMGNAMGNLYEYVETFDKYPKLIGACIWDWVDQGLLTKTEEGEYYYGYDGDFGGVHTGDDNFCLNGVIFPDRTYGGKLIQVKGAYSDIWADLKESKENEATITIHNKCVFDELQNKDMNWTLYKDGKQIDKGVVNNIKTPCKSDRDVTVSFASIVPNADYVLTITFENIENQGMLPKGHVVMEKSFEIQKGDLARYIEPSTPSALSEKETVSAIMVKNDSLELYISKTTGLIESLSVNGNPYLVEPMVPNYFRASTDNDGRIGRKNTYLATWKKAGLDRLRHQAKQVKIISSDADEIQIEAIVNSTPTDTLVNIQTQFVYTIKSNNTIEVKVKANLSDVDVPSMPRIGVRFALASGFENFEWYGNGPGESYSDSESGVKTSIYKGSVSSQWVPYPVPQENGNKTHVRWMSLSKDNGSLLHIVGNQQLDASVSHYCQANVYKARHTYELNHKKETYVNVDGAMGPLGNQSCGNIPPLDNYLLKPGVYTFGFVMSF